MLTRREDCWTKVSSWYRLSDASGGEDMKPLVQAVLRERGDRCVWGTNWPHPGLHEWMPNDADLVDQLESWIPDEKMREPLFASNAAKLYRFKN
jgi:predicted TIM-barrel fold metal-dependent hydrolase